MSSDLILRIVGIVCTAAGAACGAFATRAQIEKGNQRRLDADARARENERLEKAEKENEGKES